MKYDVVKNIRNANRKTYDLTIGLIALVKQGSGSTWRLTNY